MMTFIDKLLIMIRGIKDAGIELKHTHRRKHL